MRTRLNVDLPLALQDCKRRSTGTGAGRLPDSLGWTYLRPRAMRRRPRRRSTSAIRLEARPLFLYGRGAAKLRLDDSAGAERDLAAARKLKPSIDDDVRRAGFEFAQDLARLKPGGS
jgi:hypothetical protein